MRQTIKDVTCYPDPITGRMCVSMQVTTKPEDGPAVQFTLRVDERGVWMTPHADDVSSPSSIGPLSFPDLYVACVMAQQNVRMRDRLATTKEPK